MDEIDAHRSGFESIVTTIQKTHRFSLMSTVVDLKASDGLSPCANMTSLMPTVMDLKSISNNTHTPQV